MKEFKTRILLITVKMEVWDEAALEFWTNPDNTEEILDNAHGHFGEDLNGRTIEAEVKDLGEEE